MNVGTAAAAAGAGAEAAAGSNDVFFTESFRAVSAKEAAEQMLEAA